MVTKHSITPLISFGLWSLVIAATSLGTATIVLACLTGLILMGMLVESVRDNMVKASNEQTFLDTIIHIALIVWLLSWITIPAVYWGYLTATVVVNLYCWTSPTEEATEDE